MSSFINHKITCPNCHKEGNFTVWQSVNVDLDPKMKSKVLDGSIFKWTCPNCGETYNVPYAFLYHDMTNGFMVQFEANTPTVLMAEYIHIKENKLDDKVVNIIENEYQSNNPKMSVIFEGLNNEGDLQFAVYQMKDKYWEITDKKHVISMSEYKTADTKKNRK